MEFILFCCEDFYRDYTESKDVLFSLKIGNRYFCIIKKMHNEKCINYAGIGISSINKKVDPFDDSHGGIILKSINDNVETHNVLELCDKILLLIFGHICSNDCPVVDCLISVDDTKCLSNYKNCDEFYVLCSMLINEIKNNCDDNTYRKLLKCTNNVQVIDFLQGNCNANIKYDDINKYKKIYQLIVTNNDNTRKKFLEIDNNISALLGMSSVNDEIIKLDNVFIGNKGKNWPNEKKSLIIKKINEKCDGKNNKMIIDIETDDSGWVGIANIVQISYYICDKQNEIISKYNFYIYNDGVTGDFYGKICENTLKEYGICPKIMYYKLIDDLSSCNCIIGHNIKGFDIPHMISYFEIFGLKLQINQKIIDTMYRSRNYVKARGELGKIKNPKISELADWLAIENNDELLHDAFYDVELTFKCYKKLIEKRIVREFNEETIENEIKNCFDDFSKLENDDCVVKKIKLREQCDSAIKKALGKKMILDIETDGNDKIIQIGYFICNENDKRIKEKNIYIYNGHNVQDMNKKIPLDIIKKFGISPRDAMCELMKDLILCSDVIGHNIKFDLGKIKKVCKLNNVEYIQTFNILDTMKSTSQYVKARASTGGIKEPTLKDLCNFLKIHINPSEQHDALYDVLKTYECYLELKRKKINIKIDSNIQYKCKFDEIDPNSDKLNKIIFQNQWFCILRKHITLIAENAKLLLWDNLTDDEKNMFDSDKSKYYLFSVVDKYTQYSPCLLTFRKYGSCDRDNDYIINLNSMSPTQKSKIQTIISENVLGKIRKIIVHKKKKEIKHNSILAYCGNTKIHTDNSSECIQKNKNNSSVNCKNVMCLECSSEILRDATDRIMYCDKCNVVFCADCMGREDKGELTYQEGEYYCHQCEYFE